MFGWGKADGEGAAIEEPTQNGFRFGWLPFAKQFAKRMNK